MSISRLTASVFFYYNLHLCICTLLQLGHITNWRSNLQEIDIQRWKVNLGCSVGILTDECYLIISWKSVKWVVVIGINLVDHGQ